MVRLMKALHAVLQTDIPLPIHAIRREDSGESRRVLLGVRDFLLASPVGPVDELLNLRVALSKLHVVAGAESVPGMAVDPTMRVHTVMIAVSDEIPFELFWPMVRGQVGQVASWSRWRPGPRAAAAAPRMPVDVKLVPQQLGVALGRIRLQAASCRTASCARLSWGSEGC